MSPFLSLKYSANIKLQLNCTIISMLFLLCTKKQRNKLNIWVNIFATFMPCYFFFKAKSAGILFYLTWELELKQKLPSLLIRFLCKKAALTQGRWKDGKLKIMWRVERILPSDVFCISEKRIVYELLEPCLTLHSFHINSKLLIAIWMQS